MRGVTPGAVLPFASGVVGSMRRVVGHVCGALRELVRLVNAGRQFARDMAEAAEHDLDTVRIACSTNAELDDQLAGEPK